VDTGDFVGGDFFADGNLAGTVAGHVSKGSGYLSGMHWNRIRRAL